MATQDPLLDKKKLAALTLEHDKKLQKVKSNSNDN